MKLKKTAATAVMAGALSLGALAVGSGAANADDHDWWFPGPPSPGHVGQFWGVPPGQLGHWFGPPGQWDKWWH